MSLARIGVIPSSIRKPKRVVAIQFGLSLFWLALLSFRLLSLLMYWRMNASLDSRQRRNNKNKILKKKRKSLIQSQCSGKQYFFCLDYHDFFVGVFTRIWKSLSNTFLQKHINFTDGKCSQWKNDYITNIQLSTSGFIHTEQQWG